MTMMQAGMGARHGVAKNRPHGAGISTKQFMISRPINMGAKESAYMSGSHGLRRSVSRPMALPATTARSHASRIEAGLFSRIGRVFKSYTGAFLWKAEDPEKLIDQVTEDMNADIIKMRQAIAQV